MAVVKQGFVEEAKAIETLGAVFAGLSDEARLRVINWAVGAFQINGVRLGQVAGQNPGNNGSNGDGHHSTGHSPDTSLPKPDGKGIKAFWIEKNPKSNYQKLAVLGYHLEYGDGKTEFSSKDLEEAWRHTKIPLPTKRTFTVALHNTVSNYQYLVKATKSGFYRVGQRGEQLVAALPNAPKTLTGKAKRPNSGKKKKVD